MLFSKKIKSFYNTESGRSMIEMLGVLAIIGVLSIAGIAGYKFAVLKFRANEIINELNGRAISVSSLLLNDKHTYVPEDVIEDGFGDTLSIGYSVESGISERNSNYFEISVMNVSGDVCVQILKSYENPIMIFVNGVDYNNDTSICQSESGSVEMDFVYRNDLGEHDKCSDRGYFGVDDFQCHCSGNTYIDPDNPLECLCPAGHIWSEAENTCIESICPEGYFESLENGCVPCSDESIYTLNSDKQKQVCTACGNRNVGWFNTQTYCYNMDNPACTPGSSFRGKDGKCTPCLQSDFQVYIFETQDMADLCNACPNRTVAGRACILNTCTSENQFMGISVGINKCYSCDMPESVEIRDIEIFKKSCTDCGNREVKGEYCVKTTCASDEFMGADGQCYTCTNPKKISVNTGSGCTSTTCNRQEVVSGNKTYCQIKNCPNDGTHVNINGDCYPCDRTTSFVSTNEQCGQCTNPPRLWIEIGKKCMVLCNKGTHLVYQDTSCELCPSTTYPMGRNSVIHQDYCTSCNRGNHVIGTWCVSNTACTRGTHFINASQTYSVCSSCSVNESVNIGTHPIERQYCMDCTETKRFWAGEYCYRCDSIETPIVTESDEQDSCLSCNERTIDSENKCVLIQ